MLEGSKAKLIAAGLAGAIGVGGLAAERKIATTNDGDRAKTAQVRKTPEDTAPTPDLPDAYQPNLDKATKVQEMHRKVHNIVERIKSTDRLPIQSEALLFKESGDEDVPKIQELWQIAISELEAASKTLRERFTKGVTTTDEANEIYNDYYEKVTEIANRRNTEAEHLRRQNQ